MAEANLQETLLTYTLRANYLQTEISNLQSQKSLLLYSQADIQDIKGQEEQAIREMYRAMYSDDPSIKEKYVDYTEIPDFEEAMDKIAAKYEEEMAQLTADETHIDDQITTNDTELAEINAYKESIKQMLQSNIQEDYNYGLNS